ncbi:MAG: hypothetical protein Q4G62_01965 [Pseudomonadota bacterium]|nr:hypothetical protein [Pseudomonadota bacterium]
MKTTVALASLILLLAVPGHADAQSQHASHQSQLSLGASAEVPLAALHALSAGGKFVVTAVEASANGVSVTIESIGEGVSFVVKASAEKTAQIALAVGIVITVSVIVPGYLLSHAGEVFAYVPNPRARTMLHSREIA